MPFSLYLISLAIVSFWKKEKKNSKHELSCSKHIHVRTLSANNSALQPEKKKKKKKKKKKQQTPFRTLLLSLPFFLCLSSVRRIKPVHSCLEDPKHR
jgi:hypothetical protein